ncbi:bifunctional glutamate N-acetyltransferase/amino-acid acetyltransferase ArgJ [Maritimibacter sp. UBA3975]|uniref:bifunctional glutamate N-acetyltransferase/amino-acid acetyltransferase ArgJ n=1 Tax=Maritimibacter sp. UBA3975 TaxID=1946833 RepID=UPI000C097B77|nr:bifunctional glutamate N-acetyltransferase/amino-acid acetyltransferase ArgJ [Maritimibacter sp. UBA3975]MAM63469.1 bifunctional ornithine acetyltransferase/N-acetylglutamate synthase [Maritimibacter sp.]|tara:strand:+ start:11241 stop:12545 length:1305 start_codon:yes stop_codon:yes gene_type:complete
MGKKKKIRKLKKEVKSLKSALAAAKNHRHAVAPLAPPEGFPALPVIDGVRFSAVQAGVRYAGRYDVMLALCDPGTAIAGVFTRSATRSANVLDCEAKLGSDPKSGAAIIVNSGNSNAFTGASGEDAVSNISRTVAEITGVAQNRVYTASTGVIGERLPFDRITAKIGDLTDALDPSGIEMAARAIMTTDTFPKGALAEFEVDGKSVKIAGIAKGSGMIAPDMATMLVYIFTDAKVEQSVLQGYLSGLIDETFNSITVDSDTSTSDTLILAATGASGAKVTKGNNAFRDGLRTVMTDLAHQVVRDGEGATKFVEIRVTGAKSDKQARIHGMSIANSPLVKTAIAGEDPNWGRIVAAIGKSGAEADRDKLTIKFGEILVAEKGWVSPDYLEDLGANYMLGDEIVIGVDLALGRGKATVWTCDLTHAYIQINADYRS